MNYRKSRLYDPNLWLLLAINTWCIIYYQQNPAAFNTVLWLYWFQSVLIGLFTFLDLITFVSPPQGSDKPKKYFFESKGCSAFFFLFHYQVFHLVYAVFIISNGKPIDKQFLLIGISGFVVNLFLQFLQNKKIQRSIGMNFSQMFFMPYLRIIPMHLMILAPIFLHVQPSIIFLVLKTIADIVMYLITSYRPLTNLAPGDALK